MRSWCDSQLIVSSLLELSDRVGASAILRAGSPADQHAARNALPDRGCSRKSGNFAEILRVVSLDLSLSDG